MDHRQLTVKESSIFVMQKPSFWLKHLSRVAGKLGENKLEQILTCTCMQVQVSLCSRKKQGGTMSE